MKARSWQRGSPWLTLALLAAIYTCGFIDRILMNVLVQPIKAEFDLTDTQVGMVAGLAFALLYAFASIGVARLAERRRRLTLVTIGTIFWSVATAGCGLVSSFTGLLLARVGVGVGEAVGLPATQSIISDAFPRDKRATALSVLLLAPPLGALIGSAGGALIAQAYGWRAAFWIAAVPGLILGVLLALFVSEPERGRHDTLSDPDEVPPFTHVIARIWRRHSLRHLLIGSGLASMVGFGLNGFLAAYLLRRHGFDLGSAGVVAGLISAVPGTISVLGAGWITDRMGKADARWYAALPGIALLLSAPVYALAITRESAMLMIALLSLAALVQYCYLGPTAAVFQNMMHPRMRASSTAITGLVYTLLGSGLGPVILGALSDGFAPDRTPAGSALGLGSAMAVAAIGYAWAGIHYLLATRRIREEMALPAG